MTTMSFDEWLGAADPETPDEIYYLYYAVKRAQDDAMWSVSTHGHQMFVTGDGCEVTLLLASADARQAFLKHIEATYCEGMDIDSWYGLQKSLENPHA
jgi:hypothetical protein